MRWADAAGGCRYAALTRETYTALVRTTLTTRAFLRNATVAAMALPRVLAM
jgi:hypothetical protein